MPAGSRDMARNLISLCCCLLIGISASAQIRVISREKLDSVSNPVLAGNSSALQFECLRIAAEPMNEDDAPERFTYRFRNVSDSPLKISRIATTCVCTSAACDKRTVDAGEEAVITVTYNPKGHPGRFERRIFLYTEENTRPSAILKLAVEVNVGNDMSGMYPLDMGKVRLRSGVVKVMPFRTSVERLCFLNVSGQPLKLQCEDLMLPDCLSFRTEPEVVKEGEEGEIVITFDPEKYAQGPQRSQMQVILKGLGLPPSQSSIRISVEK